MKKFFIPAIALSFLMATTVLADPYATLETSDGNVSIVGFTTAEDSDGAACFVALLEYENKKEESNSPLFEFSIKAYQDGVELDSGYIYNYSFENYKDSDTNVRPGSTLKYFQIFKLEGNSPVDVEVAPMFNFDNQHAEYCRTVGSAHLISVVYFILLSEPLQCLSKGMVQSNLHILAQCHIL